MPFVVPFIPLLVGAGTAATTIYGAHKSSDSMKAGAAAEQSAIDKQLAFEREKEAEHDAEQERYDAEAKAQWDAEQKRLDEDRAYNRSMDADTMGVRRAEFELAKQKYADRQAQMAPYRQAGAGALAQLATLAGVTAGPAAAPQVLAEMPANWQSGDPVTAGASGAASADTVSRSLLDNPNLLPVSLTAAGTRAEAPTLEAELPVSVATPDAAQATVGPSAFRDVSTQRLATEAPAPTAAFTPAQMEAALRMITQRPASLSDLARSRKARV